MQQSPLPTGCHSIKSAAGLLGLTEKKLFKKLRELGWLYTGSYKDDPYHNTPRITARLAGWVLTQKKGYAAPYNNRVTIFYNRTLITQRGFNEIKNRMYQQPAPEQKQIKSSYAPSLNQFDNTIRSSRKWPS